MRKGPANMHRLDDQLHVSGQIMPADVETIASAGIGTIINNRPDNEEAGQPTAAEIGEAAEAAGLSYLHLPVAGGISQDEAERMAGALAGAQGPVLAFCRSGTRSTWLWAMARIFEGADPEALIEQAARAGYDIRPLAGYRG
jgi:uncharacterized protein (TIGR01244 family)